MGGLRHYVAFAPLAMRITNAPVGWARQSVNRGGLTALLATARTGSRRCRPDAATGLTCGDIDDAGSTGPRRTGLILSSGVAILVKDAQRVP